MARKILLADDSVTAQNMGRRILTDAGYEVITVNNGSAALKKMAEQVPDLIVLDVYMPGYSGLEVCQRVKENRETARIPVLLTVGKLEPFKPEEARRVKADAYIVKPFEASELLTALTKLEDKIVPLPESYKPGRFAKAIASVSGTADGFGDSETGWKDRLVIPPPVHKLHEPEPETPPAANTTPSILDRPEGFKPADLKAGFDRPLPAGLPQDITAEEIAAITAAAATISGNAPSGKESPDEGTSTSETQASTDGVSEAVQATVHGSAEGASAAATLQEVGSDEASATFASVSAVEKDSESAAAEQPAVDAAAEAGEIPAAPISETLAPASIVAESPSEAVAEAVSAVPADDEVMAAVSSLGTHDLHSGNVHSQDSSNHLGEMPDHLAAAVSEITAAQAISGPRWIAEAVALSEEETTYLLDRDMAEAQAAATATLAASPVEVEPAITEPPIESVNEVITQLESSVSAAAPETTSSMDEPVAAVPEPPSQIAEAEASTHQEAEPPASEAASAQVPEPFQTDAVSSTVQDSAATVESAHLVEAGNEIKEEAYAAAAAASAGTSEAPATEPPASPMSQELESPAAIEQEERVRETELAAAWANWHQIRESIMGAQIAVPIVDGAVSHPAIEDPVTQPEYSAQIDSFSPVESAQAEAPAATEADVETDEEGGEPEAISSIVDNMLAELKPKLMEELSKKLAKEKKKKKR